MRKNCKTRASQTIQGVPVSRLSKVYAEAAAWLERNPVESASAAILHVSRRLSFKTRGVSNITFRDSFGCWIGDCEGVLMLCFASSLAATGDLCDH